MPIRFLLKLSFALGCGRKGPVNRSRIKKTREVRTYDLAAEDIRRRAQKRPLRLFAWVYPIFFQMVLEIDHPVIGWNGKAWVGSQSDRDTVGPFEPSFALSDLARIGARSCM
ncbi:hypothetical protein ETB97_012051 [Aspergillus alliaceus]|uniref:Uncharacterized protein n=1 Tax=Petromyces alliaceus TaxID=209559 RepID=A0A8H6E7B1_PETAA|nr:hypothetical protein ETB97_012051 [Aspergillus burnettii]